LGSRIRYKLEIAMDALRTQMVIKKIGVLSGGERRRVALCDCYYKNLMCCVG
jgi:ATPase subunit of ABC transporter with duplicated ATPase domains